MAAAHPLSPGPGSRAADLAGLLARLRSLISSPEWAEKPSFLEAVQKAGALNTLVRGGQAPRAAAAAALLGRALERIARGKWPRSEPSRAFLADCIRAVALSCGVGPFGEDDAPARLSAVPDASAADSAVKLAAPAASDLTPAVEVPAEDGALLVPDEELLEEPGDELAVVAPQEAEEPATARASPAFESPAAFAHGLRTAEVVAIEPPLDPDELLVLVLAANGDTSTSGRTLFRAGAARRRRAFPLPAARRLSCARPPALGQARARSRRRPRFR